MSVWEIATRIVLGGWAVFMAFCLLDLALGERISRRW
mgnify:FL=1